MSPPHPKVAIEAARDTLSTSLKGASFGRTDINEKPSFVNFGSAPLGGFRGSRVIELATFESRPQYPIFDWALTHIKTFVP